MADNGPTLRTIGPIGNAPERGLQSMSQTLPGIGNTVAREAPCHVSGTNVQTKTPGAFPPVGELGAKGMGGC